MVWGQRLDFCGWSNVKLWVSREKGCEESGLRRAIPKLVVGPDARLPRTSPVTLDVLTG